MLRDTALDFPKTTSLLDIKRALTPKKFADFLRSQGKLFYWDSARIFVVSDYDLGKQVLRAPEFSADRGAFFISRMPEIKFEWIQDFFSLVSKMMVMSDGQAHAERRKAAALAIDGELLAILAPKIANLSEELVSAAGSGGKIDFAREIAEPLPSLVLCELFGIPREGRADFFQAALTMTQFFGGAVSYNRESGEKVNAAARFIEAFFLKLMEERRHSPRQDFFSILIANQEKFLLSDAEIIAQAVMMLVAGQVTTTDQMNNNMYTLLSSQHLERLRRDPSLWACALEEMNRLDPGVSFIFRTVRAPVVLGGVALAPNDIVFVSTHAVNRDPSIFPEPDVFQLERRANPHFAYGHGPHFCLGTRLARLEMQLCFQRCIEKFPKIRLDPDAPPLRDHYALAFSGFRSLSFRVD